MLQRQKSGYAESLLHKPPLFVQLSELYVPTGKTGEKEWRETARWIKYEENLEFGSDRWGKPHVPSLSFHVLNNLRTVIQDGVVLLDVPETTLSKLAEKIAAELVKHGVLQGKNSAKLTQLVMLRNQRVDSLFSQTRNSTELAVNSLEHFYYRKQADEDPITLDLEESRNVLHRKKGNAVYQNVDTNQEIQPIKRDCLTNCWRIAVEPCRKFNSRNARQVYENLPTGTESAVLFVAASDLLSQPTLVFLRLDETLGMTDLFPMPVRFFCLLLGPLDAGPDYHEIARGIGTLLSQKDFCERVYRAESKSDLLQGIDEFLDLSIVVPPGNWNKDHFYFDQVNIKSRLVRKTTRKSVTTERPAELVGELQTLTSSVYSVH